MTDISSPQKLDPNEQHFRIAGPMTGSAKQSRAARGAPCRWRDVSLGAMHLEAMRLALWQESIGFLRGGDVPQSD
jgi:hypothetical protein